MLAYIFPGQGSQIIGMGKDLFNTYPSARNIFETANKVLGFDLSEMCFNGPQDKLTSTENAQPAILATSIAAIEALKEEAKNNPKLNLSAAFVAGLSLGEYTALVAAEVLTFEQAVYLVRKRGQYMQQAAGNNPGKMLSIIGLSREVVSEICKDTSSEIANLNCPGQVVISGTVDNISKAMEMAKVKGAKHAILLDVSGAFHCSLMKEAEIKLSEEIHKVKFNTAKVPLVSNVTANSTTDPKDISSNLIKQVSSSTYWEDSIRFMINKGVDCFLEIGPGNVLRGLNRRISPEIKTVNLGNVEQIKTFMSSN